MIVKRLSRFEATVTVARGYGHGVRRHVPAGALGGEVGAIAIEAPWYGDFMMGKLSPR